MTQMAQYDQQTYGDCDNALVELDAAKHAWAQTSVSVQPSVDGVLASTPAALVHNEPQTGGTRPVVDAV